jgi:uncharacterized protein YfaQ (DUF2300 family)
MCLVIYPDVLPTHIHNSIMTVLESAPGQAATNLADVFHRNLLPDGRGILEALHKEGMLKKVATNQVILTPTPGSNVKLDEVNKLVKEMESGEQALKRMQEIDQNSGIVDPGVKREAERAFKRQQLEKEAGGRELGAPPMKATGDSTLSDSVLASNMLTQAKRMEVEANGLIAEAARMKKDAERMFPGVSTNVTGQQPAIESTESKKGRRGSKKAASPIQ